MENTASSPLLFLDSGIGGLSISDAVMHILPEQSIIYVADYAGFPYGTKNEAELTSRLPALLRRMTEYFSPAIITIACNTASTIALEAVRSAVDVPVVGTVPAIKPAARLTKSNVVGILGTEATVRQSYVADLARQFAHNVILLHHGAPGLPELAERKLRGESVSMVSVRQALAGLTNQPQFAEMDVLVLSCTHFPLLTDEITEHLPAHCVLIDGAQAIARRVASVLSENHPETLTNNHRVPPAKTRHRFITTGPIDDIACYKAELEWRGFSIIENIAIEPQNATGK